MLLTCGFNSIAQEKVESSRKIKKRAKKLRKKKKEDRAAERNISEDLRKQHITNQNRDVRKRMKKNKKRAKRYNDGKKSFFLRRWFHKIKVKLQTIF